MNLKPISLKQHLLMDYMLVGFLLTVPSILKMNKHAKIIYAGEALILLPYIALTRQPNATKGLIPIKMHRKVNPFNIA